MNVIASQVSKEMGSIAHLMAHVTVSNATTMLLALSLDLRCLVCAFAKMAGLAMGGSAMMSMNARIPITIAVTKRPSVSTSQALIHVSARPDTKAMALTVLLMERAWESVVIQMQSVNRALVEFQYVFASLVTEEMGGSVQILMNALEKTRIVTKKLSVSTPWDPSTAHANWDLKAMGLTANVRWRIA